MTSNQLLEFHRQMALDLLPTSAALSSGTQSADPGGADGLLIVAKGLGARHVLLTFLKIHTDVHNLVFLLNTPAHEIESLRSDLEYAAASFRHQGDDGEVVEIRPELFRTVTADTPSAERAEIYNSGGVIAITSRILVVDMLNQVVPLPMVTGIMVNHAHRLTETSTESFILRIMRETNKVAFIKAFTDSPESLVSGIWKLEKTMKLLFLRNVSFWPRFEVTVKSVIDAAPPIDLVEIRVQMTQAMQDVQTGIVECINQCLAEIKRSSRYIEAEDLTIENALMRGFDRTVRLQLESVWHKLSTKTKQIVNDLGTLRRLLGYLDSYDCVTFNSFLEAIKASNSPNPLMGIHSEFSISPWLLMEGADMIFTSARKRVFVKALEDEQPVVIPNVDIPPKIKPVLEEQPKWVTLSRIMKEIEYERDNLTKAGKESGPVLIMVEGDRTCRQLKDILSGFHLQNIKVESQIPDVEMEEKQIPSSQATASQFKQQEGRRRKRGGRTNISSSQRIEKVPPKGSGSVFSCEGSRQLLSRLLNNYFKWKGNMPRLHSKLFNKKGRQGSSSSGARGGGNTSRGGFGRSERGGSTASLRRRTRGASTAASSTRNESTANTGEQQPAAPQTGVGESGLPLAFEEEATEVASFLASIQNSKESSNEVLGTSYKEYKKLNDPDTALDAAVFDQFFNIVSPSNTAVVRPYAASSAYAGGLSSDADDDSRVLESLMPRWVVMYDIDVGFIRRLEVFKASHPDVPLKVYSMVYDNSVEEQRYLTNIRKEKDSFERLIREKSTMAIPIDQDGRVHQDPEEEFWRKLNTRVAGGQRKSGEAYDVIVDVREFGSALPSIIHSRRMILRPCTLEVGDYILTPSICVERKSLPDLIGSFKSGRLYTQVEAMCLHYRTPILLIEFNQSKTFSGLEAAQSTQTEGMDLGGKLSLLCLSFPKLRVIWSSSPQATADIFLDLKKDQPEPSMEVAMAIGVENEDSIDSAYSITPSDMIRALPGVGSKNYRYVMSKLSSFRSLRDLELKEVQAIVGDENGQKLFDFMRWDPRDEEK
ncbi:hypothetical protein HDU76_005999 [Blyttiomyces sp. JEL0837]|nr:hypothetical protein HDU76_005999 [Blyttiomyces sp. JEL0837]